MTDSMRVSDYPLLSRHGSDLRECSKDDNGHGCPVYMIEKRGLYAVCFDDVMGDFCDDETKRTGSKLGAARSADALYVGKDKEAWDGTIALIEFKNVNLMARPRAAEGKSTRKELTNTLRDSIAATLGKYVDNLDPMVTLQLEDDLEKDVETCIRECLGKPKGTRNRRKVHHKGSNPVLEEVKTKAAFSALLLQRILDKPVDFVRDNVDFVLVYDPHKNPDEDGVQEISDDKTVPTSRAVGNLQRMLAKGAARPPRRFGLRESIGAFFHDVLTLTPDETLAHIGE